MANVSGDLVLLWAVSDLARALNLSDRTVHRLNSSGRLPAPVRVGTRPRWPRLEIEQWISAGCPDRQAWLALRGLARQARGPILGDPPSVVGAGLTADPDAQEHTGV
jgi:excisionase family DNA binding protein